MDKELEDKLVSKYPNLYKDNRGDMRKTCMAFGLSIGSGWYKIVDELSAILEPLGVVAAQVKEKFGGLRFYVNGVSKEIHDEVYAAIEKTEGLSYETCESCGEPGTLRGSGWLVTMCDDCWEKKETNRTMEK